MHLDSAALLDCARQSRFTGVIRIDAGDDCLYEGAFGFADRAHQLLNTPATRFGVASASKAFTALVVLSLIADGQLNLDDPVRQWLDDLPHIDPSVTVRHLLSHTSGVGEYLDDDAEFDQYLIPGSMHSYTTPEDFVPLLDQPQQFSPGSACVYSNAGYVLLGLIAQRVSGVRYQDLVRQRVIEPAGLLRTAFVRSDALPGDVALGYLYPDSLRTNIFHLPIEGGPDGGVYTTVSDLRDFWQALEAGAIVPKELVEQMATPSREGEQDYRCGLGLWLPLPGIWAVEGADAGVSMMSQYVPAAGLTWSVIANESENAEPLQDFLMGWTREVLAG